MLGSDYTVLRHNNPRIITFWGQTSEAFISMYSVVYHNLACLCNQNKISLHSYILQFQSFSSNDLLVFLFNREELLCFYLTFKCSEL